MGPACNQVAHHEIIEIGLVDQHIHPPLLIWSVQYMDTDCPSCPLVSLEHQQSVPFGVKNRWGTCAHLDLSMNLEIRSLQPARLSSVRSVRYPGGLNVEALVAVPAGAARAFASLLRGSKTAFQWARVCVNQTPFNLIRLLTWKPQLIAMLQSCRGWLRFGGHAAPRAMVPLA